MRERYDKFVNVFSNRSAFGVQNSSSLLRLFLVLLLVAALPIFIWAVLTQRIELRKRASTSEPTQVCWNRVVATNGRYQWPNGCRGNARTDLMCTQALIPLSASEIRSYEAWVTAGKPPIPGCGSTKPRPTPSPRPGCYYKQVECIQAPCDPILVCPTPTGPTCIPRPRCLEGTPKNDGQVYCAQISELSAGTRYCPPLPTPTCTPRLPCMDPAPGQPRCMVDMPFGGWFCPPKKTPTPTPAVPTCKDSDGGRNYNVAGSLTYTNNPNGVLQENDSCDGNTLIEGVCNSQTDYTKNHERYTCPNGCSAGKCSPNTSTSTPTPTISTTPTPTPVASQTIQFRVKLTGVDGAQAEGAKINVKFATRDGIIQQLSVPLTLTHIGNGVYQTSAVLTNPFSPGTSFTIAIKGEKHLAVRFCKQVGQTVPCADGEYITVPNPTPLTYGFDFTGFALPPGDTTPQDGRADQTDIDRIKNLMTKSTSTLTDADKLAGDLNYDGVINGFDLFLILQTLRTRYDGF
jgi:hypothetical protein